MTGKIFNTDVKRIGEVSSDEMIALRPQCIDSIEDLDFDLILVLVLILLIQIHLLILAL